MSPAAPDNSAPVLVTGATGYVAGWLIKSLLDAGLTVHAAVRDPDNQDKLRHLTDMAATAPGTIRFFRAELLEAGSYAEAMAGCRTVFHTASPFTTTVKDPQRELIDPARNGTRNVLEQAIRTPAVERVVLTSSCAAIYTDACECTQAPGGMLTEAQWNTTASTDYQPYAYSKTVAEQEAWSIAQTQSRWDLVVINPSLVIGPATRYRPTSESFNIVRQFGDGTLKSGAPRLGFGVVDVRDVAQAHFAAAFTPTARGRHIISGHDTDLFELGRTLLDKYGDRYPIPRRVMPKWLAWLVGPMISDVSRRYIARNVNWPWHADTTKGRQELGLTYRPMRTSMEEMFGQMVEAGYFRKP